MDMKENVPILLSISVWLPSPSVLHFISRPTWCELANICNHTGIPQCSEEQHASNIRLFLDDCDMFEYNCDNHREFDKVAMLNCQQTTTVTTQSTISTEPVTNASESTVLETTTSTIPTTYISRVPIGSKCTRRKNISSSITTDSSNITASSPTARFTTMLQTTTLNHTITQTMSIESTIMELATSNPPIAEFTPTESKITETTIMKTTPNNKIAFNFTREPNKNNPTTQKTTGNENPNITREIMTTVDHNTVNETVMVTTVEYEEVEVSTKKVNKEKSTSAIPLSAKSFDCKIYPKECKRPFTWETTAKGETRDFYQILRAKFGNRVKLLRGTTHWPRKYIPNEIDGTFMLGRHSES